MRKFTLRDRKRRIKHTKTEIVKYAVYSIQFFPSVLADVSGLVFLCRFHRCPAIISFIGKPDLSSVVFGQYLRRYEWKCTQQTKFTTPLHLRFYTRFLLSFGPFLEILTDFPGLYLAFLVFSGADYYSIPVDRGTRSSLAVNRKLDAV